MGDGRIPILSTRGNEQRGGGRHLMIPEKTLTRISQRCRAATSVEWPTSQARQAVSI